MSRLGHKESIHKSKNVLIKILRSTINAIIGYLSKVLPDLEASSSRPVVEKQIAYDYQVPENYENLGSNAKQLYSSAVKMAALIPPQHIFKYKDVFVSYDGLIFKNFRIALPSLDYPGLKKEYTDVYLLKQWMNKRIKGPKEINLAVVYDAHAANNYYHWLIEACPRLLLLKEENSMCTLVVPSPTASYVTTISSLLGFHHLFPIHKNEVIKAEHILLAEHTSDHNFYTDSHQNPFLLQRLREEIVSALELPPTKPYKLVYVSRAKQKIRRATNEADVTSFLQSLGFEIVFFEDMSFKEQVLLMHESLIVIGIHGANLANILFMQEGAYVIEIEGEKWNNLVYFRLASYLNLRYHSIRYGDQPADTDIEVHLPSLELLLKQILNLPK